MNLAACREDLEEDGFESAAGTFGMAFGPGDRAGNGCTGGAREFDGGGVGEEEGVDFVAKFRRESEEGKGATGGFAGGEGSQGG